MQWCKVDYTTPDSLHHTPHNPVKDAASTSSDSDSGNSNSSSSCSTDTTDIANTCSTSASTDTTANKPPASLDSTGQSVHAHTQYDNTMNVIDVDTALSSACETIWYGNIGR